MTQLSAVPNQLNWSVFQAATKIRVEGAVSIIEGKGREE